MQGRACTVQDPVLSAQVQCRYSTATRLQVQALYLVPVQELQVQVFSLFRHFGLASGYLDYSLHMGFGNEGLQRSRVASTFFGPVMFSHYSM